MKLSCGSQIGNSKELEGRSPVKTLCLARTPVACTVHVSDTMLHAWLHMSQKSCLLGALLDLPPDLDDGRLPFTILAMSSNICGVSTFALEQKMFTLNANQYVLIFILHLGCGDLYFICIFAISRYLTQMYPLLGFPAQPVSLPHLRPVAYGCDLLSEKGDLKQKDSACINLDVIVAFKYS